jgi:uncharacterized protein YqeY
MSLKARILEDVKSAMRARETAKLSALRLLTAAIKQKEVDERVEPDDAAVLNLLEKLIKQRKDSISQFSQAGRMDLVAAESAELDILSVYLPTPLSEAEILALIQQAIADTGASSPRDMGKVVAALKPQLAGRADMGQVSQQIKAALAS